MTMGNARDTHADALAVARARVEHCQRCYDDARRLEGKGSSNAKSRLEKLATAQRALDRLIKHVAKAVGKSAERKRKG